MTIGERCRGLRILVTPVRRGEGPLTTDTVEKLGRSVVGSNISNKISCLQVVSLHYLAITRTNLSPFIFLLTFQQYPPRADPQQRYQASCVDDPVEARAIWYVAPRSGAVMCPAYVARS